MAILQKHRDASDRCTALTSGFLWHEFRGPRLLRLASFLYPVSLAALAVELLAVRLHPLLLSLSVGRIFSYNGYILSYNGRRLNAGSLFRLSQVMGFPGRVPHPADLALRFVHRLSSASPWRISRARLSIPLP